MKTLYSLSFTPESPREPEIPTLRTPYNKQSTTTTKFMRLTRDAGFMKLSRRCCARPQSCFRPMLSPYEPDAALPLDVGEDPRSEIIAMFCEFNLPLEVAQVLVIPS